MEISTTTQQGITVAKVTGRLDSVTGVEFEEKSAEWTEEDKAKVVIDFSELEYISSYGLRSLLAMTKALNEKCGRLAICGISGLVEEIINVSGFDTIIPIYDDVHAAVAAELENG